MVASPSHWSVPNERSEPGQRDPLWISLPADYMLLDELRYLRPHDRCMIELRFRVGLPIRKIAAITRRSHSSVARRLLMVDRRLHDPIVQALQRNPADFEKDEREIAMLHFAGGQSIDRIARDRHLARRHVMTLLATVRAWHRHLCAAPFAAGITSSRSSRRASALSQEKHHDRDE